MRPSSDAVTAPQGGIRTAPSAATAVHQQSTLPRSCPMAASQSRVCFRPPPGLEPPPGLGTLPCFAGSTTGTGLAPRAPGFLPALPSPPLHQAQQQAPRPQTQQAPPPQTQQAHQQRARKAQPQQAEAQLRPALQQQQAQTQAAAAAGVITSNAPACSSRACSSAAHAGKPRCGRRLRRGGRRGRTGAACRGAPGDSPRPVGGGPRLSRSLTVPHEEGAPPRRVPRRHTEREAQSPFSPLVAPRRLSSLGPPMLELLALFVWFRAEAWREG